MNDSDLIVAHAVFCIRMLTSIILEAKKQNGNFYLYNHMNMLNREIKCLRSVIFDEAEESQQER